MLVSSDGAEHWIDLASAGSVKISHVLGNSRMGNLLNSSRSFEYTVALSTVGVSARLSADGRVVSFVTASGAERLRIDGYVSFDASSQLTTALSLHAGLLTAHVSSTTGNKLEFPVLIDPLASTPAWTIYGTQAEERFGATLALGDLSGSDNRPELAIGAPRWNDPSAIDVGRVYIVTNLGTVFASFFDGAVTAPYVANTLQFNRNRSYCGMAVAIGMRTSDGVATLAMGCPRVGANSKNSGAVYVFDNSNCKGVCDQSCTVANTTFNQLLGSLITTPATVVRSPTAILANQNAVLPSFDVLESETESFVSGTITRSVSTYTQLYTNQTVLTASLGGTCEHYRPRAMRFNKYSTSAVVQYLNLAPITRNFTIDLWFRGITTGNDNMIRMQTPTVNVRFYIRRASNVEVDFDQCNTLTSGTAVNDGAWHHIAYSYNNINQYLFIDGVLRTSGACAADQSLTSELLWMYIGSISSRQFGVQIQTANFMTTRTTPVEIADIRIFFGAFTNASLVTANIGCDTGSTSLPIVARWDFSNVTSTAVYPSVGPYTNAITYVGLDFYPSVIPARNIGSLYWVTYRYRLYQRVNIVNTSCTTNCGKSCTWTRAQESPLWADTALDGAIGAGVAFGDVFSDGLADLVDGSQNYAGVGAINALRSDFAANVAWANPTANSVGEAYGLYGTSVLSGFDFTNDGRQDLIIGAPRHSQPISTGSAGRPYQGMVALFGGGTASAGPSSTVLWSYVGPQPNSGLGVAMAGGDINCDGKADLVLGMPYYLSAGGFANAGAVAIFIQFPAGLFNTTAPNQLLLGTTAYSLFGYSLAMLGNFDKTGCADIAVGSPYFNNIVGGVSIFLSNGAGLFGATADQMIVGTETGAAFGYALAGPIDMDGDTWQDLVISAYRATNPSMGGAATGKVVVHLGQQIADLSLTAVSVSASSVLIPAGYNLLFTVSNAGSATATSPVAVFTFNTIALVSYGAATGAVCVTTTTDLVSTTVTCTLASIAASGSIAVTVPFTTVADVAPSSMSFALTCSSEKYDPNGCSAAAGPVALVSQVDLEVTILSNSTQLIIASALQFVVQVAGLPGRVTATNVVLSMSLPSAAFQQVSIVPSPGVVCFGALSCSIPRLRSGEAFNVTMNLLVLNGISGVLIGGILTQKFNATTLSTDVALANNVAQVSYPLIVTTNAALTLVANPTSGIAGGSVNIVGGVENVGLTDSPAIVTLMVSPPGVTSQTIFTPPGVSCMWAAPIMTCSMLVPTGAQYQFSLTFGMRSDIITPAYFNATVATSVLDVDLSNNKANVTVPLVFSSDVGVALQIPPALNVPGLPALILGTVVCGGPSDSTDALIRISAYNTTLAPSGLVFDNTLLPPGVSCVSDATKPSFNCTFPYLVSLLSYQVYARVTADYSIVSPLQFRIEVLSTGRVDSVSSNDVDTATMSFAYDASVFATMRCLPSNAVPIIVAGTSITCVGALNALGPNTVTDANALFTLPPGAQFLSLAAVGYTYSTTNLGNGRYYVVTTVPPGSPINPGQSVSFTLIYSVTFVGTNIASVYVNATRPDLTLADNYAEDFVTVSDSADMQVLVSTPSLLYSGSTYTAVWTMANLGASVTSNATSYFEVTPINATIAAFSQISSNWTCAILTSLSVTSAALIRCDSLVPLPAGATFTVGVDLAFASTVLEGTSFQIRANITSPQLDTNLLNNYAQISLRISTAEADVAVAPSPGNKDGSIITDQAANVGIRGESMIVTVRMYNNGSDVAYSSEARVTFPAITVASVGNAPASCGASSNAAGEVTYRCQCGALATFAVCVLPFNVTMTFTAAINFTVSVIASSAVLDPVPSNNVNSLIITGLLPSPLEKTITAKKSSNGLGLFLILLIALLVAICLFFLLAALGFFKRKKPPTKSEQEAEGQDGDAPLPPGDAAAPTESTGVELAAI